MAEFPNQYSTSPVLNAGSTAHTVVALTFVPQFLRIYNAGSVDLYVDFKGNAPSTGTSHIIKTSDALVLNPTPVPLAEIGLTTTSTSAAGQRVSVVALGSR